MVPVDSPRRRLNAPRLRRNPRRSMAARTRSAVSAWTPGSSLTTRETVLMLTPAWCATSLMVARRALRDNVVMVFVIRLRAAGRCQPDRQPDRTSRSVRATGVKALPRRREHRCQATHQQIHLGPPAGRHGEHDNLGHVRGAEHTGESLFSRWNATISLEREVSSLRHFGARRRREQTIVE